MERIGLFLASGAVLVSGLGTFLTAGPSRAPKAPVERKGPAPARDESLTGIANYQISTVRRNTGQVEERRSLAEIVNPFPAQRKRRSYGSLYEFHRNNRMDARNFFEAAGEPRREFRRNQFGATFGATLTERLNLFASYEGLRIFRGSTLLSHVPTSAMKSGDFGREPKVLRDPLTGAFFDDNRVPEDRIHPIAGNLLRLYPDPNRDDPDRNFVNQDPSTRAEDSLSLRADYEVDRNRKLFMRYGWSDGRRLNVGALPTFSSRSETLDQSATVTYSQTLSPRLVSRLQFRFSRQSFQVDSENVEKTGLLESIGIVGIGPIEPREEGYPDFILSGYASLGDGSTPSSAVSNGFNVDKSVTYVRDNHTLRLGTELDFKHLNDHRSSGLQRGRFVFNGSYTGDAFGDFLLGLPYSASRALGPDRADLRGRTWQLFLRDEWKVSRRFDLSLGVTYNYFQPYRSVHENVSVLYPLLLDTPRDAEIVLMNSPRAAQLGLSKAGPRGAVFSSLDDWSPRVSLAFSPTASRRFVLRSSYTLFYSPVSSGFYRNFMGRNVPHFVIENAQSSSQFPELDLSRPFETLANTEQTVRGIEPRLSTPYVQRWQLSLQRTLAQNWFLETAYVGSKGTRLPRVLPGNVPEPGPGPIQARRPNPEFGLVQILTGSGSSTQHSLDINAERRLVDGMALQSGFTWTRQINDLFSGNPANPRHLRGERGPSNHIPARRLYLNYILDLPFRRAVRVVTQEGWFHWLLDGWRLSGITRIQDGTPFSVTMAGDPNNDGLSGERPDRQGPATLSPDERSIDAWFSVADFAAPPIYEFGNSGRNILVGPGYQNWDVSLVKQTRIQDGNLLEVRVEFFNAFNQVNFNDPGNVFGTSLFGKVFGAGRSREIELAVRYNF